MLEGLIYTSPGIIQAEGEDDADGVICSRGSSTIHYMYIQGRPAYITSCVYTKARQHGKLTESKFASLFFFCSSSKYTRERPRALCIYIYVRVCNAHAISVNPNSLLHLARAHNWIPRASSLALSLRALSYNSNNSPFNYIQRRRFNQTRTSSIYHRGHTPHKPSNKTSADVYQ